MTASVLIRYGERKWKGLVEVPVGLAAKAAAIQIPAGDFLVEATLPSGESLEYYGNIAVGEVLEVDLAGQSSSKSWETPLLKEFDPVERIAERRLPAVETLQQKPLHAEAGGNEEQPPPLASLIGPVGRLRFWSWCRDHESWRAASVEPTPRACFSPAAVSLEVDRQQEPLLLAEVAGDTVQSSRFCMLPVQWQSASRERVPVRLVVDSVKSVAGGGPWRLRARTVVDDPDLSMLLSSLSNGALLEAARLGDALAARAETLLEQKGGNPSLAAAAALALLKMRNLKFLHDWTYNLATGWNHLPDGATIRAWHLLYQPDASKGPQDSPGFWLVEAARRGVPLYTESLRLLVEGLDLLGSRDREIAELRRIWQDYLWAADTQEAFTSFRGSSPTSPGNRPTEQNRDGWSLEWWNASSAGGGVGETGIRATATNACGIVKPAAIPRRALSTPRPPREVFSGSPVPIVRNQEKIPMNKSTLKNLLADREVMDEIRNAAPLLASSAESITEAADGSAESSLDVLLGGNESAVSDGAFTAAEAIVLLTGRPPLLIQDGIWQEPEIASLRTRLAQSADSLKRIIPTVGRLEVISLGDYVGTGWMIDEGVLITNRHVAEIFAERVGSSFSFRRSQDREFYKARIDFKREYQRSDTFQARVSEIVYLEESGGVRPDMALIRLAADGISLPEPVELDDSNPRFNDDIAVIGYPAEDSRNDAFAMRDIFKGVYNVKRLSPGKIRGVDFDGKRLLHDCTTLGGNSGSVLVNLATGKACGLHFSGNYRINNYAVSVGWLKARLAEIGSSRLISTPSFTPAPETRRPVAEATATGYNPLFLGSDFEVPLPGIGTPELIAPVTDSPDGELKYTHFSVVMHSRRRLPFFTACNIDGDKLYNFTRGSDRWFYDGRLSPSLQIGEELYTGNSLDRGHLVRRLDPAWGDTREEARRGEEDTFYFTNCSPQHSRLNQRTWLGLEDYILGNAATHDLKVTVFTGPVLAETDREYRELRIPEEFWKVVVIVNSFTGQLSATAYLLSQSDYLGDLEFAFGEFRTYQLPVAEVARKTGLNFGDLSRYDPLNQAEGLPRRIISDRTEIAL